MDIEAMKKVNALTIELQKHGIAPSSEEAYQQAQQIFHSQDIQKPAETPLTTENHNDTLLEKKYELMLTMNNKKFDEQIHSMQDSINTLTQELSRLKTELASMHTRTTSQEEPKKTETPTAQPTPAKKEEHPRQGSFTPGDISIEKMFYFGNK